MKTTSIGIKILNIIAIVSGFTGMLMAVKLPGTLSLFPLLIALILGVISILRTRKNQVRCSGCYLGTSLAIIGFGLTLFIQLTTEPEVAVDKKFDQQTQQTADEAEDELDDLLNEEF